MQEFSETLGPQGLLMILLMLGAVAILVVAAFSGVDKAYLRRLERAKGNIEAADDSAEAKVSVKRSTNYSDIATLDRLIRQLLPRPELLRLRLARAALSISLGTYLITNGVIAALVLGILSLVAILPTVANFLVAIFAGIGLPHMFVGFMIKRRRNKFLALFPDAIELMVRGIKSGLPLSETISSVGTEIPDPVGEEFRTVFDSVKFGRTLEESLWDTADRLDLQEFKFFTISLAVQQETGGNLAESLNNLGDVLRGRRQLKLKVKALSSEAKASAMIIGALPFVMGSMIYIVNPGYISKLFIDPRGHTMLAIGFGMFALGVGTMIKMVKFEI